eukprot:scaffold3100_cov248-Pinguiococcus_pyrenoidosus.AAC.15
MLCPASFDGQRRLEDHAVLPHFGPLRQATAQRFPATRLALPPLDVLGDSVLDLRPNDGLERVPLLLLAEDDLSQHLAVDLSVSGQDAVSKARHHLLVASGAFPIAAAAKLRRPLGRRNRRAAHLSWPNSSALSTSQPRCFNHFVAVVFPEPLQPTRPTT